MTDTPTKLADLLPSRREVPPGADMGTCPRCDELLDFDRDGYPVHHRCCVCQDTGWVRADAKRGDKDFGKALQCAACAGSAPEEDWAATFRIPPKFRRKTLADWKPDDGTPRRHCELFATVDPPPWHTLFLFGSPGGGKTHLACATLRLAYEHHGARGRFWDVPSLLDRFRASYDAATRTEAPSQIYTELEAVPILVLDDLGANKAGEWADEQLFKVINFRYSAEKQTVVTTNRSLDELDPRIRRRITDADGSAMVVKVALRERAA